MLTKFDVLEKLVEQTSARVKQLERDNELLKIQVDGLNNELKKFQDSQADVRRLLAERESVMKKLKKVAARIEQAMNAEAKFLKTEEFAPAEPETAPDTAALPETEPVEDTTAAPQEPADQTGSTTDYEDTAADSSQQEAGTPAPEIREPEQADSEDNFPTTNADTDELTENATDFDVDALEIVPPAKSTSAEPAKKERRDTEDLPLFKDF
ncbi:MAG: hypothetical protein WCS77_01475 [Elusimicrobiaceae bacterium]